MRSDSTLIDGNEARPDIASSSPRSDLALVMGGGGARAAYQVGVLRAVARERPDLPIPILTGVSAGAINAAHLAAHQGDLLQATEELAARWMMLNPESVFRVDIGSLARNALRWFMQLLSGGGGGESRVRGLVDTDPLRRFLSEALNSTEGEISGISENIARNRLRAIAISTTSYTSEQSVTWLQGAGIREWERPSRTARHRVLSVEHVMASAALPLFFPAIEIEDEWYGDGGIRLAAPLSPAIHLGASRILAVSTRSFTQKAEVTIRGYPPPAQVAGVLLNAIFLDLLDQDALRLESFNELLKRLPLEDWRGMRPISLLIFRPSVDLAKLANRFEPRLPRSFRFMTRGLGTRPNRSPDFLSLILFQEDYLAALIAQGEADARARMGELLDFLVTPVEKEG